MNDKIDITTLSFACWLINKGIKNERGVPLEFVKHNFLFDIARDKNKNIVVKKCAQIGCSILFILRAYWFAKYMGLSTIYTMPSDSDIYEFVPTKVDKIYQNNEEIRVSLTKDTTGLKGIDEKAFLYFKGTRSKSAPLSTTADVLAHDEIDRCLEPDTEVLTKTGWKKIQNITTNDSVASLHNKEHSVSFKKPLEVINMEYEGDFYRLRGRSMDIGMTPNHKLWARTASYSGFQGASNPYTFHKAKDLYEDKFVVSGYGRWTSNFHKDTVSIPYTETLRRSQGSCLLPRQKRIFKAKQYPAIPFYKFLGWYLSEGCLNRKRNNQNKLRLTGGISIAQKQEKYVKEIQGILQDLGYNPKTYKNKRGICSIQINDFHLALVLKGLDDSFTKYIPTQYLWGDVRYLPHLLETLLKGDGDERNVYTTASKRLADDVQVLALRLRKSAVIYKNPQGIYKVGIQQQPYKRINGFRDSNTNATLKKEYYKGKVYCLNIPPYHTFLIRGKDKKFPIWSGNSEIGIINQYSSRTDYSEYKGRWVLSNPSISNSGIDNEWRKSDQREWVVTCRGCKKEQILEWEKNVDFIKGIYVCQFCGKEITNQERMSGEWKSTAESEISGYHISQLMAAWLSAKELIDKKEKFGEEVFYNFVLGEPYNLGGIADFRTMIMDALTYEYSMPSKGDRVAIGLDIGRIKHYVAGTTKGIFDVGTVETRKEVVRLIKKYDPIMVIDALPERTWAEELQKEFPENITLNFFSQDKPQNEMLKWGGDKGSNEDIKNMGLVWSHRTRVIDKVISEFLHGNIVIHLQKDILERYISQWETMHRIVEIDKLNRPRYLWNSSNGNNHYALATVYYWIALQRLGGEMEFLPDEQEIKPDIERRMHGLYIRPLKEIMDEQNI